MKSSLDEIIEPRGDAIAIVGIGCRFPGGIRDLAGLGALLTSGADAIGPVPEDRWSPVFQTSSHAGSFLADVDRFDAQYFGISPREAGSLDPQHRLLLEVAAEAMADSGRPLKAWRGTRTAVYIGMLAADYTVLHAKTLGTDGIGPHYASGLEFSFAAGRLAYAFDFHGPVTTLNSACSSSLFAVHLAAQSLRAGECDTALAGGVNLLLVPELSVFMSQIGAISPTGRCRPFDTAADGVVRGEGCGIIALKRLADAVADGDRVYATVRASAVNHDGFSLGLTAPNATAQTELLTTALASANLDPADVDYVEAHGTGTPLGDHIELSVLTDVYGTAHSDRSAGKPLWVGSHKAVFGHTDAAAGIAGLLKAVWVVNSGQVPVQPHLESPVPSVDWERSGIAVPTANVTLGVEGRPARAAVSAFGLSGTNAHVIVEGFASAPEPAAESASVPGRPHVLLVSSHHPDGLRAQVAGMRDLAAGATEEELAGIVASAAVRRGHESHRFAVVAADRAGLVDALSAYPDLRDGSCEGHYDPDAPPKIAFAYSGQGSQWPRMAADLYDSEPAIREALEEIDALIRRDASWSLVKEIRRARKSRLPDTDVAQPAIFAIQVALTRWWSSIGLTPEAVVGHSVGEVAAAHAAGSLSLPDAVRLVVRRGEIMHSTSGTGRMTAVSADEDQVRRILDACGLPVSIAVVNGPGSVVIAGEPDAVGQAAATLSGHGLRCQPLPVDYAFHSPVVAHCGPLLRAALGDLAPAGNGSIRLLSSVDPDRDLEAPDAAYWERNLTQPVLLGPAVARLLASDDYSFVEIGPHPVLARPLTAAIGRAGGTGQVITTLRRNEPGQRALLLAAARLHVAGTALDWPAITGRPRRYTRLPVPAWGGDRYWLPGVARGHQGGQTAAAQTGAQPAAQPVAARVSLLGADGSVVGEFVTAAAGSEPGGALASAQNGAQNGGQGGARVPAASVLAASAVSVSTLPVSELSASAPPASVLAASALSGTAPSVPAPRAPESRSLAPASAGATGPEPGWFLALADAAVRKVLGLGPRQSLPRTRGLFELGLDSLGAVELRRSLESELGVTLSSTVVFEHPTVQELAAHLQRVAGIQRVACVERVADQAGPGARSAAGPATIAVVGVACRLPEADSPDEYWRLVTEGRQVTSELPAARRADPSWAQIGADVPTPGGYLDDITGFDAEFFRIAPREARSLDPQQRLLLEVAWEALDDAGIPRSELAGRPAGVYVGLNTADYQQLLTRDMADIDLYYGTGTSFAATAGRLSYFLGLRGPSLAVDTACSSSLTAVHLACQALREGECELALAGGANVIVSPTVSVSMSAGRALAPDGRCKTFDEAADGYGRGEGAAVFVLKPLEAARRDGDRVYAVIAGSAVNSDGASGGLTVPSADAQVSVIRQALRRAGWDPASVDYVEAHGTGTPLGDPIEARALADALGPGRPERSPVLIGSVKANLGHLEAAAGAAGLLKAILAVRHAVIPPHLVGTPSSRIDWDSLPVELAGPAERQWPTTDHPRRAGVSAFGFSGSNAHVLVEEAPAPDAATPTVPATSNGGPALPPVPPYVLPVTAASPLALRAAAKDLSERIAAARPEELPDIVWTATRRRSWLDHRLAVVGTDAAELAAELRAFADGGTSGRWAQGFVTDGAARENGAASENGADSLDAALAAARLYVSERDPVWNDAAPRGRVVSLPAYPWQRRRHWYRDLPEMAVADGETAGQGTISPEAMPGPGITGTEAASPDAASDLIFTVGWEDVSLPGAPGGTSQGGASQDRASQDGASDDAAGMWLVAGDGGQAEELVRAFARRGDHALMLDGPRDGALDGPRDGGGGWLERLGSAAAEHQDCRGLVLCGGSVPGGQAGTEGVLDGLAIAQATASLPRPAGALWFLAPSASPLWELGRVLAVEMPARWGGLVDCQDPDEAVRAITAQREGGADDQLRLAQSGRQAQAGWQAARLCRVAKAAPRRAKADTDRWHLVIGAAGGAAVAALERLGASQILWAGGPADSGSADSGGADSGAARACSLAELPARLAELGELGDVVAVSTPVSTARLADVPARLMAGQLADAVALTSACTAALSHAPRRVTLITSAGSTWGSVNSAASAAAAGHLASWAASHADGRNVGLLGLMPRAGTDDLAPDHRALFASSGLRPLSEADAAAAIERVLLDVPGQYTAASVDTDRYVRLCQDLAPRAFLDRLAPAARTPRADWITALPPSARAGRIEDHVIEVVAEALGTVAGDLDPQAGFFDLGMDSVMALNVRTELEDTLGIELPSTLTFEYPTVVQLAAYLAGFFPGPSGSGGAGQPAESPPPDTLAAGSASSSADSIDSNADADDDPLRALELAMAQAEQHLRTSPGDF